MKTLILYVFHQECDNLRTFISRGLIDTPDKEFIFIYNDPSFDISTPQPTIVRSIPSSLKDNWSFIYAHSNVHLLVRPNIGQDFQGWNTALFLPITSLKYKIIHPDMVTDDYVYVHQCFDNIIFINSTVVGPYIPTYLNENWTDYFVAPLSETTKIVGISANFMATSIHCSITKLIEQTYGIVSNDHSHIQSMIFALDRIGLQILIKYGLFAPHKAFPPHKDLVIILGEIAMSVILRHEGFSMFSMMISQGLISSTRKDNTDNFWNHPSSFPLHEFMFVKTLSYTKFPEKDRYNRFHQISP